MAGAKIFLRVFLLALLAGVFASGVFAQGSQGISITNADWEASVLFHCVAYDVETTTEDFGRITLGQQETHLLTVPHSSTRVTCDFASYKDNINYFQEAVAWENNDPYLSSRVSRPCSTTPWCEWMIQGDGFSLKDTVTGAYNQMYQWIPL